MFLYLCDPRLTNIIQQWTLYIWFFPDLGGIKKSNEVNIEITFYLRLDRYWHQKSECEWHEEYTANNKNMNVKSEWQMKKYGHVCFQLVASALQRCVMTLHCASHNPMFCVHDTKPSCKHTKQCFKHTKITLHRSHLSELQCCTDDFPFIVCFRKRWL